jgi:hypothetical protein
MNIDEINNLCREIAEETLDPTEEELAAEIEQEELDSMMLALGPYAFGPDEGANDSDGLFYWDLK